MKFLKTRMKCLNLYSETGSVSYSASRVLHLRSFTFSGIFNVTVEPILSQNLTTGTEAVFDGTFINGEPEPLVIRNNDSLQVLFVPEQNYVKYGFEATFTIFDKVIVDKEYPFIYKMLVKDIVPGTYTISCEAKVESSEASISESGEAKLTVME